MRKDMSFITENIHIDNNMHARALALALALALAHAHAGRSRERERERERERCGHDMTCDAGMRCTHAVHARDGGTQLSACMRRGSADLLHTHIYILHYYIHVILH